MSRFWLTLIVLVSMLLPAAPAFAQTDSPLTCAEYVEARETLREELNTEIAKLNETGADGIDALNVYFYISTARQDLEASEVEDCAVELKAMDTERLSALQDMVILALAMLIDPDHAAIYRTTLETTRERITEMRDAADALAEEITSE
jgi:hypothetical protein